MGKARPLLVLLLAVTSAVLGSGCAVDSGDDETEGEVAAAITDERTHSCDWGALRAEAKLVMNSKAIVGHWVRYSHGISNNEHVSTPHLYHWDSPDHAHYEQWVSRDLPDIPRWTSLVHIQTVFDVPFLPDPHCTIDLNGTTDT
jgi:hypothetical protein